MARFRKVNPIRDHLPFLIGAALCLLLVFLFEGYPYYGPFLKGLLPWTTEPPPIESTVPPAETPSPAESADPPEETEPPSAEAAEDPPAPAETAPPPAEEAAQPGGWRQLLARAAKLWPALLALIAVMEAAEYIGKFFALIRRFFRFLKDQF